ncbi:uncharacterized protein LOC143912874 [Arctopsyche grandis]|uniref:uncharacterized protein LOC143912874 n=1 Tax=Arctopsyche grandis TaxID=121162 RepID=UPI00406D9ACB
MVYPKMIRNSITTFSIVFIGIYLSTNVYGYGYEDYCPTPCDGISMQESLKNLWNLSPHLPPLAEKFKHTLLDLVDIVPQTQLSVLMGQSLWALDRLTGFNPEISLSCTYANLIKQTYASENGHGNINEYNQAVKEYGDLALAACENSISIGLSASGCPVQAQKYIQPTIECPIESYVFEYVNHVDIPYKLKLVIIEMLQSTDEDERAIALAAVATATKSSAEFFKRLFKQPELQNALKMKGCNEPISPHCCQDREIQLSTNIINLKNSVEHQISCLTS